jgi:uncharacterized protein (UPF0548 family)
MILLRKPTRPFIDQFIAQQTLEPFNYSYVGRSRTNPPADYVVDHNRVQIGQGEVGFTAACDALNRWQMFNIGWVQLCWPDAPIQEGTTVAILVHIFGIWWLNAARIVYLIDETAPSRWYGFAYGTLTDHAESGEERFMVEWRDDDTVWYDLLAFSRPYHPLAKVGRPLARQFQKRFAKDSLTAMKRIYQR